MVTVASKDSQLRLLIPDFIDTLALFISNINEVFINNFIIYRNTLLKL